MLACREHGDHSIGALDGSSSAVSNCCAIGLCRVRRGFDQIERDYLVARLDQIGSHRPAHIAKADECDVCHVESPPRSFYFVWMTTSSWAQISAKYGAIISDVTSSIPGGDQRGLRSLSITAARTPSRKSSVANPCSAARYSRTRHSSSEDEARASRSSLKVTTMPRGDFSFNVFRVDCASSEPSRCSSATMSCIRSWANQRSICVCIAATGPKVSPVAKLSITAFTSAELTPARRLTSASRRAASLLEETTASAKRA